MALFLDDFNRADSNTVGNSWGEEENAATNAKIASNKVAFLDADSAVIYRAPPNSEYNNIKITAIFDFTTANPGTHGIAVRWAATGGRNIVDSSLFVSMTTDGTTGTYHVYDNNNDKGSFTKETLTNTAYDIEWKIDADNAMEVRIWADGGAYPTDPDLTVAAFSVNEPLSLLLS